MYFKRSNAGRWATLVGLACLASVLLSVGAASAQTRHIAMVDAGSSGSRLHLYSVERKGAAQEIRDLLDVSGNAPGLSSFAQNPSAAGDGGMGQLIASLNTRVKELGLDRQNIELHVMGTAGMRLIAPEAAQAVYDNVRTTLNNAGYAPKRIVTISGEMEAFYGWTDANFLLGHFAPDRQPVGVIEIGGASMQIAYPVESGTQHNVTKGLIFGREYHVRTMSFLGLGVNEARRQMMQDSAKGAHCYPVGAPIEDVPEPRFDAQTCRLSYAAIVSRHKMAELASETDLRKQGFIGLGRPMAGSLALWKLSSPSPAALGPKAAQECAQGWNHIAVTYGANAFMRDLCANSTFIDTVLFDPAGLNLGSDAVAAQERLGNRVPNWPRGVVVTLAE